MILDYNNPYRPTYIYSKIIGLLIQSASDSIFLRSVYTEQVMVFNYRKLLYIVRKDVTIIRNGWNNGLGIKGGLVATLAVVLLSGYAVTPSDGQKERFETDYKSEVFPACGVKK